MNIDLEAVRAGRASYADLVRNIRHADLYTMIDELFAELASIFAKATDGDAMTNVV